MCMYMCRYCRYVYGGLLLCVCVYLRLSRDVPKRTADTRTGYRCASRQGDAPTG